MNITSAEHAALDRATPTGRRGDLASSEWLTFRLGGEEYGIDILLVQEIRSYEKPTRIAGQPRHFTGVVDLRGVIVPIVDLRMKFGLAETRCDTSTVTIVVNIGGRTIGMVVDAVSDVLELKADDVKPFPGLASGIDSQFIRGIGSPKSEAAPRMLILLDIVGVLDQPALM